MSQKEKIAESVVNPQVSLKQDEDILVVKRNKLFIDGDFQGLQKVDADKYLKLIDLEKEFLPRSLMELDFNYKQIIPYLIFNYNDNGVDKYFLMQRQSKATEQRLKNKFSLGIGGHIRKEDLVSNNIVDWARREFEEEVNYTGNYSVELLGVLNDDSNAVGQVHVGFVFLLRGDSNNITVNSELKSGELLTVQECELYYSNMESWTQICFDYIKSNNS